GSDLAYGLDALAFNDDDAVAKRPPAVPVNERPSGHNFDFTRLRAGLGRTGCPSGWILESAGRGQPGADERRGEQMRDRIHRVFLRKITESVWIRRIGPISPISPISDGV